MTYNNLILSTNLTLTLSIIFDYINSFISLIFLIMSLCSLFLSIIKALEDKKITEEEKQEIFNQIENIKKDTKNNDK